MESSKFTVTRVPNLLSATALQGRAVIAYAVRPDQVEVLGVFYGGQDVNAAFEEDDSSQADDPDT